MSIPMMLLIQVTEMQRPGTDNHVDYYTSKTDLQDMGTIGQ